MPLRMHDDAGICPAKGLRVAQAALRCVGAPFRLHGRDRSVGLDCVGLALLSLQAVRYIPVPPDNYRLAGPGRETIMKWAFQSELIEIDKGLGRQAGDILLVHPAPGRSHLLVATASGFVHAHLGCRKVVKVRGDGEWPIAIQWRLRNER